MKSTSVYLYMVILLFQWPPLKMYAMALPGSPKTEPFIPVYCAPKGFLQLWTHQRPRNGWNSRPRIANLLRRMRTLSYRPQGCWSQFSWSTWLAKKIRGLQFLHIQGQISRISIAPSDFLFVSKLEKFTSWSKTLVKSGGYCQKGRLLYRPPDGLQEVRAPLVPVHWTKPMLRNKSPFFKKLLFFFCT